MILQIVHWVCRLFLSGIFFYAGYTKLENPLQFAAALEAYQLFPLDSLPWLVKVVPWLEIVLGLLLIVGLLLRAVAALAGGLLLFFVVVMTITFLRGIEADCGCFGVGERISPFTLVRDVCFILPALFLIFQSKVEALFRRTGISK
jgi:uncharacterized membrane protein YphA (DoxX/SURF4 family)